MPEALLSGDEHSKDVSKVVYDLCRRYLEYSAPTIAQQEIALAALRIQVGWRRLRSRSQASASRAAAAMRRGSQPGSSREVAAAQTSAAVAGGSRASPRAPTRQMSRQIRNSGDYEGRPRGPGKRQALVATERQCSMTSVWSAVMDGS